MAADDLRDPEIKKPTNEDIRRVEDTFVTLCKNFNVKWGTDKYFSYQTFFFSGAIIMCNYSVISWTVGIMSRREIVPKF